MGTVNKKAETKKRLREILATLEYDSETGLFRRKGKAGNHSKKGWFRGTKQKTGYRRMGIGYLEHMVHRLAWAIHYGAWPRFEIDHIDGNRDNNRIKNLREVNHTENSRNAKLSKWNTSGVCGVHYSSECTNNPWYAKIRHDGENIYLGYFATKKEAIRARKDAESKYGYHMNHGRSR